MCSQLLVNCHNFSGSIVTPNPSISKIIAINVASCIVNVVASNSDVFTCSQKMYTFSKVELSRSDVAGNPPLYFISAHSSPNLTDLETCFSQEK